MYGRAIYSPYDLRERFQPTSCYAHADLEFSVAVPTDIKAASLTHLFYAFANVGSDGTVKLSDTWADEEVNGP